MPQINEPVNEPDTPGGNELVARIGLSDRTKAETEGALLKEYYSSVTANAVNHEKIMLEKADDEENVGNENVDEIAEENTDKVGDSVSPLDRRHELDAHEQNDEYLFNPILYTRGIESDAFHLILSGKVNVTSGNEGFMITQSAFNYLGADALVRDDYKPDFSANVVNQARILRISRTQYRKALSSLMQTKHHAFAKPNGSPARMTANR